MAVSGLNQGTCRQVEQTRFRPEQRLHLQFGHLALDTTVTVRHLNGVITHVKTLGARYGVGLLNRPGNFDAVKEPLVSEFLACGLYIQRSRFCGTDRSCSRGCYDHRWIRWSQIGGKSFILTRRIFAATHNHQSIG